MSIQFSPVIAAKQRPLPGFSSLLVCRPRHAGACRGQPVAVLDDFRGTRPAVLAAPARGLRRGHLRVRGLTRGPCAAAPRPQADPLNGRPRGDRLDSCGQRRGPRGDPGRPGPRAARDPDLRQPQRQEQAHGPAGASSRTRSGARVAQRRRGPRPRRGRLVRRRRLTAVPAEPFTLLDVRLRREISFVSGCSQRGRLRPHRARRGAGRWSAGEGRRRARAGAARRWWPRDHSTPYPPPTSSSSPAPRSANRWSRRGPFIMNEPSRSRRP